MVDYCFVVYFYIKLLYSIIIIYHYITYEFNVVGGGTWSFSLRGWLGSSPSRGFGAPVKSKPSYRSSEPAVATTDHDPESESAAKSE